MNLNRKIEFPISVALVGASNSGKSKVAKKLQKVLKEKYGETFSVVANGGTTVEKDLDIAMGHFGSYRESLLAFFQRLTKELELKKNGKNFISCGTAIENIAYTGVKVDDIRTGIQIASQEQRLLKEMSAVQILTFLFLDTFQYDLGFYLPINSVIKEDDDAYNRRIDLAIKMVDKNFNIRLQVVEGSVDQQVNTIVETIDKMMFPAESDTLSE